MQNRKTYRWCLVLTLVLPVALTGPGYGEEDADTVEPVAEVAEPAPAEALMLSEAPHPSAEQWRVSALIQFSGGTKVGFVDVANKDTFFLGVGDRHHGVELVEADFEGERVILRKEETTWALKLATDPNAPAFVAPAPPVAPLPPSDVYRGEGIEKFLREYPEAVVKGNLPTLTGPPPDAKPVEGFGEGIEKFLRENPELAKKARQPAVGRGETIERFLRENPELAEQVNRPVQGKGEGIERFLREHPELETQAGPGIPLDARPPEPPAP
jgi:hypothetical protein